MKFKVSHFARKKAGITIFTRTLPIVYLRNIIHLRNNENPENSSAHSYKTESRCNVIKALKKLYLRYYRNIVKALTDRGPYLFETLIQEIQTNL